MYVEPQVVYRLDFSNKPGEMLYSRKWRCYELRVDPNRRIMEHIYTGWKAENDNKVEIRY